MTAISVYDLACGVLGWRARLFRAEECSLRRELRRKYWRANLRLLVALLTVWFAVSFLAGIVFADQLDSLARVGGFPLGFWFANQGSMIFFVLIIAVYVFLMRKLDEKYGAREW